MSKMSSVIALLEKEYGVEKWQNKKSSVLNTLIKTILSQSTSDWNRDMAWKTLKDKYPHWEEVLHLSREDLAKVIHSAGLANQKAERILNILRWIQNEYGQLNINFICDLATEDAIVQFTKLKGVGIKTISVVLAFACGKDILPVDTHVHRLCRRFGFVAQNVSAEETHSLMQNLVPPGKSYSFHINLLKHGRKICKARNPLCDECAVYDYCEYELKEARNID